MKTSWQTETGALVCRWSVNGDRIQYDPPWIQEASSGVYERFLPPTPNFVEHSLLGSGEWFVPWHLRWSVPRPSPEQF